MEPALRGMIEKVLDYFLTEESINKLYDLFKSYKENAIIESIDSAIFGSIVIMLFNTIVDYKRRYGQEIQDTETEEFEGIINSRAYIIKSRIRKITSH